MKMHILVIEDEAIIAQDIERILLDLGYYVPQVVHSSEKAIDYLSFYTPDLVLCDIYIKGSMDGIAVANTIRQKKKIPFVFLTSFADRTTLERAKQVLPYGYIVKPFDERDLLAAIEVALFKFKQEVEALTITNEKVNKITSSGLTHKEYTVLTDLINGLTYDQITDKLNISNNTLKYHTKNIFSKFEAFNRAEVMQKLLLNFTDQ